MSNNYEKLYNDLKTDFDLLKESYDRLRRYNEQRREMLKEIQKQYIELEGQILNIDLTKKAFAIANNAIYFNDRSDYKSALWDVCKTLNPMIEDDLIGRKHIEE